MSKFSIPDGYEELTHRVVIQGDYLTWKPALWQRGYKSDGAWVKQSDLGGSSAEGKGYQPGNHYVVIIKQLTEKDLELSRKALIDLLEKSKAFCYDSSLRVGGDQSRAASELIKKKIVKQVFFDNRPYLYLISGYQNLLDK